MQAIETITDFLFAAAQRADSQQHPQFRVYDLSRRVQLMDHRYFATIERGEVPFPHPRQGHAWLGIVFWTTERISDPFIWFVKLPLDERALFQHAARQDFLRLIVAALGTTLTEQIDEKQQAHLPQNPYIFIPDEIKLAAFHAHVSRDLNLPPSIYFEDADQLFRTWHYDSSWQDIGIQGIHDVVARLQHPDAPGQAQLHKNLVVSFQSWPDPLAESVMQAMEHQRLPQSLQTEYLQQLSLSISRDIEQKKLSTQSIRLLRLTSGRALSLEYQSIVRQLLIHFPASEDMLLVLAARSWQALLDLDNLHQYLVALAKHSEGLFVATFKDLVMLAEIRPLLLHWMRHTQPTDALKMAIDALVKEARESGLG